MAIDDLELKLSKYETVWLYHALLNMTSADIQMAVPTYPALIAAGIARDLRGRLSLYIKGITINTEYEVVDELRRLTDNHGQDGRTEKERLCQNEWHDGIRRGDLRSCPECGGIHSNPALPANPHHRPSGLCVTNDTLPDKPNGDK